MLSDTKLGLPLARPVLEQLAAAGDVIDFRPGERVWAVGDRSEELVAVLRGDLDLERGAGGPPGWIGPGDVVGAPGFVLGCRRETGVRARGGGCRLWCLPRTVLTQASGADRLALLARLLTALSPIVRVRIQRFRAARAHHVDPPVDLCNPSHPAITHLARFLARADQRQTATAIWDFVRYVAYRIGFWDVSAAEVLRLGFGMCTTKATLQVALLRASRIESAFGEAVCPSALMAPLVPAAYRHFITRKPNVRHYFAVARLAGRWQPLDATFPPAVWRALHSAPSSAPGPYGRHHAVSALLGPAAAAFDVHPDLNHVVAKRPFFDEDSVEAMNLLLDRIQGCPLPRPGWAALVERLLPESPRAAFEQAYAALSAEIEELRHLLLEPRPAPAGDAHDAVL
jgi:transglutaminase-like putative cysteine protease